MHEESTAGSMSSAQIRSGGALNVYDPEISMWLPRSSGERVQVYREVGEIVQRPRGQEVVHKRQRRLESARQRCVTGRADERVQPDQAMTATLKTRDLLPQFDRISAIPSVGDE